SHVAMGQEAGKSAWPKPSGGYQTIRGRRYGRRHAYIGFRPSLNSQDRDEHQHNEDCERLELEENSLRSSPLVQVSSGVLDEPLLENVGTGEPICQNVSRQTFGADTSAFSLFSCGLEGNQISGNFMDPYENSEDLAEYVSEECNDLNGQNGFAFVNIDSYKPDSSDGEEDEAQDKFSLAREEASVFQETLDNMLSELEKGIESFTDLQSQLSAFNHSVSRDGCEEAGPMPLIRYFSIDSDLACPNNRTFNSSADDQAIPKSNPSGANSETQQIKNIVNAGIRTPIAIANELNVNDGKADQGNSPELVVRPKIRKQNTANRLEGEQLLPSDDEEESGSWRRIAIHGVQQSHAEHALRNSREDMSFSMFFSSRECDGHRKNTEIDLRKCAAAQEQKNILDDGTSCDEFEDCSRLFSTSHRYEDSSECSDGEWSVAVPTYFSAKEKDQSSSDESWETAPGREELDLQGQRSSSGVEEKADFCFHGGERVALEEGEIPWLQYREEVESSSDEENDPGTDFLPPGFFLLDGNNNLEDDSSVSEDLDVEWRLLDEFGDGLGLAQAIPYIDPQFLTFMALEGHLQAAMETALAHLESLGFDMEEAQPPATKEAIDSLPRIVVTDDHGGQEQCCIICCSEYVRDEIITELPCHHFFHRACVTLWLKQSGTCPVCRHVLAPVLPEASAASVSFMSDRDSAPSV
ncbi:E3 ubiquitin-protein ligase Praja-2, partial [Buceros rhinoceros silvestris]